MLLVPGLRNALDRRILTHGRDQNAVFQLQIAQSSTCKKSSHQAYSNPARAVSYHTIIDGRIPEACPFGDEF
jgi:hypothetical protein